MSKSTAITNGLALFGLGIRIEIYNQVLFRLFRHRRFMFLCLVLDKRLEKLRKEFQLLEERHKVIVGDRVGES